MRRFGKAREPLCGISLGCLLFALSMALSGEGYAQETPGGAELRLSEMKLNIWPEYDDPRVLVIYEGKVAGGPTFPLRIRFVLPQGAQIHMAGAISPQGGHLHSLYEITPRNEGWVDVSWELATSHYYMEFYYDPFEGGADKRIEYLITSYYPVDRLEVLVQQPLKASDFEMTPFPLNVVTDAKGFSYSRYVVKDLPKDKTERILVSYRKTDPNPSVRKGGTQGQAAGPLMGKMFFYVAAGLLVIVVVALLRRGQRRAKPRPKGTRVRGKAGVRFCTHCGTTLDPSANFCPNCGKKVQIATS